MHKETTEIKFDDPVRVGDTMFQLGIKQEGTITEATLHPVIRIAPMTNCPFHMDLVLNDWTDLEKLGAELIAFSRKI